MVKKQLATAESENATLQEELVREKQDSQINIKKCKEKNKAIVEDLVRTLKSVESTDDRLMKANTKIEILEEQHAKVKLQRDTLWQSLQIADQKLYEYEQQQCSAANCQSMISMASEDPCQASVQLDC